MPVRTRGFSFEVETYGEGVPLQTYGTRSRGPYAVTTKIQAQDGVKWQLRVRLTNEPSQYENAPVDTSDVDMSDADLHVDALRSSRPFEYVACLRLGDESLCTSILFTDPRDPEFEPTGYILDGRWRNVRKGGRKGNFESRVVSDRLIFTENGMGLLFAKLYLNDQDAEMTNETQPELTELAEMAENLSRENRPLEHSEIRVEITRQVLLNKPSSGSGWVRTKSEGVGGEDGTHRVAFSPSGSTKLTAKFLRSRPWRNDEAFFCYASFHYLHMSKLVKLGLAFPDGTPKPHPAAVLESIGDSEPSTLPPKRHLSEIDAESDSRSSTDSDPDSDSDSDTEAPRKRRRAIDLSKDQPKPQVRGRKTELVGKLKPAAMTLNAQRQLLLPDSVPNQSAFTFRSELPENLGQAVKKSADDEIEFEKHEQKEEEDGEL